MKINPSSSAPHRRTPPPAPAAAAATTSANARVVLRVAVRQRQHQQQQQQRWQQMLQMTIQPCGKQVLFCNLHSSPTSGRNCWQLTFRRSTPPVHAAAPLTSLSPFSAGIYCLTVDFQYSNTPALHVIPCPLSPRAGINGDER